MEHLRLNPAVRLAAEQFTDGEITDRVLADVAAMKGLPLYLPAAAPSAARLAADVEGTRAAYVRARAGIGEANRAVPANAYLMSTADRRTQTAAYRRWRRADAFRALNRTLAALRRAEAALTAVVPSVMALAA